MKKLGTYQLGWRWVDVYLNPNEAGAEFQVMPGGKGSNARIILGLGQPQIESAWGNLNHESLEMTLTLLGCRWRPDDQFSCDASDTYVFSFNHDMFSEAVAQSSVFTWLVKDDFEKAWKKHHKIK